MLELLKEESPLEFAHGEVKFMVKPRATAYDRMQVMMAPNPTEFMERTIKQMVVGWNGVSQNGEVVRYSFDLLKLLPEADKRQSTMILLGNFIIENTDVVKTTSDAKNA